MLHVTLPKERVNQTIHTAEVASLIPFVETAYINKTGKAVYISDRHGAYMTVPPLPASTKLDGKLHVDVSWHTTLYSQLTFNHQNVNHSSTTGPAVCQRANLRYSIEPTNYLGNDVIYSAEIGVLISFERPLDRTDVFPNTPGAARRNLQHFESELDKVKSLNINIIVVDNVNPDAPYYLNIENRIYKLYAKTTEDTDGFPDGVHIIDSSSPIDGFSDTSYTLKECVYKGDGKFDQPLTLFTNPHDAKTNGNRSALLDAEMHARDVELKRQESEILGLKSELNRAKEEALLRKEKLDSVSDSRKDYYESRSHTRKDTTESYSIVTKLITSVCGLGVAAFGLYRLLI